MAMRVLETRAFYSCSLKKKERQTRMMLTLPYSAMSLYHHVYLIQKQTKVNGINNTYTLILHLVKLCGVVFAKRYHTLSFLAV